MSARAAFALRAAIAVSAALASLSPAHAREPGGQGDGGRAETSRAVRVAPYIEASQVLTAELSPGNDVVTYSQIAVGVDASVHGRNTGGSASVRYERSFGWGGSAGDVSTLSGVARGYASVVPRTITIEAGALAARSRLDGGTPAAAVNGDSRIYSAFAGPSVHTRIGDAQVNAHYRVGYSRFDSGPKGQRASDDSVVHNAAVHVGTQPGAPLPVGVGVGAGYTQEDLSVLDQRVRNAHVRADVSVPISPSLVAVGGVGYEDVEVTSRDAVRDAAGIPVVGADGRFATDRSAPRRIAYDTSGLIWDVGVMWRPSRRTAAEAHFGRRYGSTTYYGSFAWVPNSRSSVNLAAYDGISGFGGQLTNALAAMPTDFSANRNAVSGDLDDCVDSLKGNNCLSGVLGSVRSATFRGRGFSASYARKISNRLSTGVGAGYDRRTFLAAPGTVLAASNGLADESWWLAAYLAGRIDARSSFALNGRAGWYDSELAGAANTTVLSASAAYHRMLLEHLAARAAVAFDHVGSTVPGADFTTASALVGLRYDF